MTNDRVPSRWRADLVRLRRAPSLLVRGLQAAAQSELVPESVRARYYRFAGMDVGTDVRIGHGVHFADPAGAVIGARSFIGTRCYVENHARLTLGDDVWVAARCHFATASHAIGSARKRAGAWRADPIVVGDGTWLGAGVTVLGGVTIGPGCIVAAGAVVVSDCEPNGLYAGIPAVRKRDLGP